MSLHDKGHFRRVAVTGMGCISVAGRDICELRQMLYAPQQLFRKPTRVSLGFDIVVAEIPESWYAGEFKSQFDTVAGRMSYVAAQECLEDGRTRGAQKPEGFIMGSSAAGQEQNETFVFSLLGPGPVHSHDFFKRGVVASAGRFVSEQLDIQGQMMTISTACTSSANALALGASWIAAGRYDSVLVGGCDDICATTLSGFHTLLLTGPSPCQPFAAIRPGMTLGDGAAFLLLEPLERCLAEQREWYAEVAGFGMTADAQHMTSPSVGGVGAIRAMQQALAMAGLKPEDISWINAHGTGTELNDRVESEAIHSVFPDTTPVSSNKGLFGHTLGAAGALEAIVSIVAMQSGRAPQNFFNDTAGPDCPVRLVPGGGLSLPDRSNVLSNSFGFGGSNCSLIFCGNKGQ